MASGKYTWRITDFSGQQSKTTISSDVFTVGGCNWIITIYPKGNNSGTGRYLSMYLFVANPGGLPSGWTIGVKFSLTITNQLPSHNSTTFIKNHEFTAQQSNWGWHSFKGLTELHDSSKGFLVNDTLVAEAEVEVLNVSPPTLALETFLSNLDKFITNAAQGRNSEGSSSNCGLKSEAPTLEEVEIAKQSLKECLSDTFKLNIKDRLATSLQTLSRAEIGVSYEEQRAVELFWGKFEDFVADFLTFEQENSEFELHKLATDRMFLSIKNYHETHHSNKRRLDDLTKEEEECKKRMEEAKSKKAKLISDWQTLMTKSEETKSKYMAQEKKLEEAKQRKKIAEEKMSRSTSAWSSLKAHFAN